MRRLPSTSCPRGAATLDRALSNGLIETRATPSYQSGANETRRRVLTRTQRRVKQAIIFFAQHVQLDKKSVIFFHFFFFKTRKNNQRLKLLQACPAKLWKWSIAINSRQLDSINERSFKKKKNQLKKSMSHNRKCCVVCVEIARREKKCPVGATCIQFIHRERTCGRAARALNLKAMKPNPCVMTSFAFAARAIARAMEEERGGGGGTGALSSVGSLTTAGRRSTERRLWIPRLFHWHLTGSTWPGVSPRTPRFDRKGLESESRGFAFSRPFRSLRRNWCAYTFSFN